MDSFVVVIIIAVVFVISIIFVFSCLAIIQRRNRGISQSGKNSKFIVLSGFKLQFEVFYNENPIFLVEEGIVNPKYQISTIQSCSMNVQHPTMNPVQFPQSMNTQNVKMPVPCSIYAPSLINPYRNINPLRIVVAPLVIPTLLIPTFRF